MRDREPVTASPVGRLMRFEPGHGAGIGRWVPVGDPLPPFAHAPPDPSLPIAPWVLPRTPAPHNGDVVVVGETAHQLLAPCEREDAIYHELAEQTLLFHSPEETVNWLHGIEVWVGRRLRPGEAWPRPATLPE